MEREDLDVSGRVGFARVVGPQEEKHRNRSHKVGLETVHPCPGIPAESRGDDRGLGFPWEEERRERQREREVENQLLT